MQIERHVIFTETDAIGGGVYSAVDSKATLRFKGEFASLPAWDYPLRAMVLYRSKDTRNWIIVAASTSCEFWRKNGRPRPPYWEYELIEGQWRQVTLRHESMGRSPNLFTLYASSKFGSHVSEPTKERLQSDRRIADMYRSIADAPRDFHCM